MHRINVTLAMVLISTIAYAQPAVEGENSVCTANNDPYQCCSGASAGICDKKGVWPMVKNLNKFSEFCASFWFGPRCDDEPYFSAAVCSQADRDAGNPLPTVTCNEAKAEEGWCRANLGCVAEDDPWNCCTGLDTGTCPYDGSDNTPKKSVCLKAIELDLDKYREGRGIAGQRLWNLQDDPPFVPESG